MGTCFRSDTPVSPHSNFSLSSESSKMTISVQEKLNQKFPDTVYTPLLPPGQHPAFVYNGFHPGKVDLLPRGHVKEPGFQAFPVDVIWEHDQAISMRDGITLYGDVFRPSSGEKFPAIIPWSPYGKVGTGSQNYDRMGPWRIGIPYQRLSGYETFEVFSMYGTDPQLLFC